jgi:NADH dehydrogenase FAD-containing subunit
MRKSAPDLAGDAYDVLVLGAGYAGLMAALRLSQRRLGLRVALVNAEDPFVERVRLQESMVHPVVQRIASLTDYLRPTVVEFICGRVTALDPVRRTVRIEADGEGREVGFSQAIYALGSRVDVENVPGAADYTYRLDAGDDPQAAGGLRLALRALREERARILAVGGGALSVEAAAEVKSMWPQMDVTLVSASRAGDFKDARVEAALREGLDRLGVKLIDNTKVREIGPKDVVTDGGQRLSYDLCIWAAGMRSPPIARDAGLEVDDQGRVLVGPDMRSVSHPFILAAGDCAHPVAPTGAPYRLSALTAAVSGVYAGEQAAAGPGERLPPFSFSTFAQAVAVGRYAAVFPLDANDNPILFVLRGRLASHVRGVLIWLVLHFITLERHLPGLQSWPGRRRISQRQADEALRQRRGSAPTPPARDRNRSVPG